MIGAILRRELLGGGRRRALFAVRTGYLAVLLLFFVPALAWLIDEMDKGTFRASQWGQQYTLGFGFLQMALIALLAPAIAMGAFGAEQRTGIIEALRASGVSEIQLVLGKLVSRVAWLGLWVVSGAPMLLAGTMLGGAGPDLVALILVWCAVIGLAGICVGMAASLWLRNILAAVLASYGLLALLHFAPLFYMFFYGTYGRPAMLAWSAPASLVARSLGSLDVQELILPLAAWTMLALLALVLCPIALRVFTSRSETLAAVSRAGVMLLDGGSRPSDRIGGNPIAWRERRSARRSAQLRGLRLLWLILGGSFSFLLAVFAWLDSHLLARTAITVDVAVGTLLTLFVAATCVADESERNALELLKLSPMSGIELILGKLEGIAVFLLPVLVLPLMPSIALLRFDLLSASLGVLASIAFPFLAASIGILFSTLFARTVTAVSALLATIVVWCGVLPLAVALMFQDFDRWIEIPLTLANPIWTLGELSLWLGPPRFAEYDWHQDTRIPLVVSLVAVVLHTVVAIAALQLAGARLARRD